MEAGVHISEDISTAPDAAAETTLSNLDLAKFLIEDTSKQVAIAKNYLQECMRDDRHHFEELVNLIVKELGHKINKSEELLLQSNSENINKVKDLELYVKTVSSYHEQLIITLNEKLNDQGNLLETIKTESLNKNLGSCEVINDSSINLSPVCSIHQECDTVECDENISFSSPASKISGIQQVDGNDSVASSVSECLIPVVGHEEKHFLFSCVTE